MSIPLPSAKLYFPHSRESFHPDHQDLAHTHSRTEHFGNSRPSGPCPYTLEPISITAQQNFWNTPIHSKHNILEFYDWTVNTLYLYSSQHRISCFEPTWPYQTTSVDEMLYYMHQLQGYLLSRVRKTSSARQQCWRESFCNSGEFLLACSLGVRNI